MAVAREMERTMQMTVAVRVAIAKQLLLGAISTAEITREWAPLAAYLDTLVADEVLRQSCGDAVTRAEKVLGTLRAEREEKERVVAVSLCNLICTCFIEKLSTDFVSIIAAYFLTLSFYRSVTISTAHVKHDTVTRSCAIT